MRVLVTGGAGYIGSHTLVELLAAGHTPVVIDNLCNSSAESIKRVEQISGTSIEFHTFDLRDKTKLAQVFHDNAFDAVLHFAGLKAVGESVAKPLLYYRNNLESTLAVLEIMQEHGVTAFLFSSSATVYGTPTQLPLTETSPTGIGISNPYGWTKYMIERITQGVCAANPAFRTTILRYFNPIGAHESGLIGEDPQGIPNNLLPYVAQVAVGKRDHVTVYGNDYDTADGTGVRDYIHVVDLARGHVAALAHLRPGVAVYNLGSGQGTSVLELIHAFEQACGHPISYEIGPRRPGDIAACYASAAKAAEELGWHTEKTITDACVDTWRWQSANPEGYSK